MLKCWVLSAEFVCFLAKVWDFLHVQSHSYSTKVCKCTVKLTGLSLVLRFSVSYVFCFLCLFSIACGQKTMPNLNLTLKKNWKWICCLCDEHVPENRMLRGHYLEHMHFQKFHPLLYGKSHINLNRKRACRRNSDRKCCLMMFIWSQKISTV